MQFDIFSQAVWVTYFQPAQFEIILIVRQCGLKSASEFPVRLRTSKIKREKLATAFSNTLVTQLKILALATFNFQLSTPNWKLSAKNCEPVTK